MVGTHVSLLLLCCITFILWVYTHTQVLFCGVYQLFPNSWRNERKYCQMLTGYYIGCWGRLEMVFFPLFSKRPVIRLNNNFRNNFLKVTSWFSRSMLGPPSSAGPESPRGTIIAVGNQWDMGWWCSMHSLAKHKTGALLLMVRGWRWRLGSPPLNLAPIRLPPLAQPRTAPTSPCTNYCPFLLGRWPWLQISHLEGKTILKMERSGPVIGKME